MIEIFKTNVPDHAVAEHLTAQLLRHLPGGRITFDLEDCDRVLRVERQSIKPVEIIEMLNNHGYHCCILEW